MREQNLHPSVQEFKAFLKKHPAIIEAIRESGQGYQAYYEKWALLGEEDPYWQAFRKEGEKDNPATHDKEEKKSEWFQHLLTYAKNTDMQTIKTHVGSLNETIDSLQEMLAFFQKNKQDTPAAKAPKDLFHLFRD